MQQSTDGVTYVVGESAAEYRREYAVVGAPDLRDPYSHLDREFAPAKVVVKLRFTEASGWRGDARVEVTGPIRKKDGTTSETTWAEEVWTEGWALWPAWITPLVQDARKHVPSVTG